MREEFVAVGVLAMMLLTLLIMIGTGISQGMGSLVLIIFSMFIATAALFFDEWFTGEEEE
jgi:hypothetical protein